MDVSEIRDMLASEADRWAAHFLPGGRRQGREWTCKAKDSPTGSPISVCIGGHKQGLVGFWNGSDKRGGSLIDLIMEVEGRDLPGAVKHAKWLLGLDDDRETTPEERRRLEARRKQAEAERAKREAEAEMDAAGRLEYAKEIWQASQPLPGTAAERYLLNRGLGKMEWPESLRFHPDIKHQSGKRFPALICRVTNAAGFLCGIWRIYVTNEGQKAPVELPKMGLGQGGAVILSGGKEWISVTEGVETGLGALQMAPNGPAVYALLSTSGMMGWEWPPFLSRLTIYPDGDRPKFRPDGSILPPPGMDAAARLARRAKDAGIPVTIQPEPNFCDMLDVFNRTKHGVGNGDTTGAGSGESGIGLHPAEPV